jgi:hypothetical protein
VAGWRLLTLPYVGSRLTMKGSLYICLHIYNILHVIPVCLVPVNMLKCEHLTKSKTLTKDISNISSVRMTLEDHDCHGSFLLIKAWSWFPRGVRRQDGLVDGKPSVVKWLLMKVGPKILSPDVNISDWHVHQRFLLFSSLSQLRYQVNSAQNEGPLRLIVLSSDIFPSHAPWL